ncbi:MAG: DUF4129 domain-containing protein [Pyrinomonadaceae bacterium]
MNRSSVQFVLLRTGNALAAVFIAAAIAVSTPVFGKTLKEYAANVSHLKADFAEIIANNDSGAADIEFENEVFEEVPELLPAEESIEAAGITFYVDNSWITSRIKDYKNETQNEKRKSTILSEIYERLESIEIKLGEVEGTQNSLNKKDENKRKIAEILGREQFQKPTDTGESFLQRLWRQIREWLNSVFPRPNISPNTTSGIGSLTYILQIVLYAVIFALIGFLIYRFAPLIYSRFKRSGISDDSERIILGEKLDADATPLTLFSEAEKLASEGNLKAAIRKGYIALLFELSERKHLALAIHKTNRDYLRDVRLKQSLYDDMSGLTSNYERHWYGLAPVVQEDWEEFRKGYKSAVGHN